jgi:hypothetical protein
MQSITIAPEERKDLIRIMKRERQPSRSLRMHIVLLASEGLSPTQISRVLFCSRTTVYAVVARFAFRGSERPFSTEGGEAQSRRSTIRPTSGLSVCSKKDRLYISRVVALTQELQALGL